MKKISLLENNLINKIAAGEVVERPLSVVKELVENSIDAGASDITIEIKDGGTSFIRVTDNGSGIPRDEVKIAFIRHATSKIENINDLENVLTLGFRGEALSSIASVSKVEITSKTPYDITGLRLEIDAGKIERQMEIGGMDGTTIIVRNLFFNTPARRKFLKKSTIEGGYISDIINRLAIGNPHISFKYINNGTIILNTKGSGELNTAILQVFGKDVYKNLMEVKHKTDMFSLTGYIGKPEISRGNRSFEHFFINGRYVKNEIISSAVENVYKTRLFGNKFPWYVLFMEISPEFVDVNVHPSKMEVRFLEEDFIHKNTEIAIEEAFKNKNLITETSFDKKKSYSQVTNSEIFIPFERQKSIADILSKKPLSFSESYDDFNNQNSVAYLPPANFKKIIHDKSMEAQKALITEKKEDKQAEITTHFKKNKKTSDIKKIKPILKEYKIVGQIFSTYWIIEQEEFIFMLDQHAAHERVMYENIINQVREKEISSQILLNPILIKLTELELQIVKNNKEVFEKFGFEIEEFGYNTIAIRSVPYIIDEKFQGDTSFFIEIIDKLSSVTTEAKDVTELKNDIIATMSCKAAIKGNNKLSYPEIEELIEKVMSAKNPFTCPHGRPTIIEISKSEIERKFKRT